MTRSLHKPGSPGNATRLPKRNYPRVLATFAEGRVVRAIGREGATLLMLVEHGPRGVRTFDFVGCVACRLSAYVHDLRRMGITIGRRFERHATGSHAVYVLKSNMTIVSVDEGSQHD